MNRKSAFVSLAAFALFISLLGCQRPKSEPPAALSAEDAIAVGNTIDSAIQAYIAKDLDRFVSFFAADLVNMEYDRYFHGIDEFRQKHAKPEIDELTVSVFKQVDRIVRGRGGFAYVSERNVIEYQTKDGKTWSTDSGWASYVLEKQPGGAWKIVQYHFSGPMAWTEKKA